MVKRVKIIIKNGIKYKYKLIKGEIKEGDKVVSLYQFENMNNDGYYLNTVYNKLFEVDVFDAKYVKFDDNDTKLCAGLFCGQSLIERASKVQIDILN